MARNDTPSFTLPSNSWRALASEAVATALAVALVVSTLALMEAAFSTPASQVAQRFPSRTESQRWHAGAERAFQLSTFCVRDEPARCLTD